MKVFGRWIAKFVGGALTLVMVFALLPYATRIINAIMPEENGAAIKASAIIATHLEASARLETLKVEEEGVLNYDIQAALIGNVASINVRYAYAGSFGIDLSKVQMQVTGNEIVFRLPAPEVLQDALIPLETYRNDFWYPGFSDDDYDKLLEKECSIRREAHLTGKNGQHLVEISQRMFEDTIASWIRNVNGNVEIRYETVSMED